MLLEISNLSKYFGGLTAVNDIDISVEEGTLLGLIGPNGAGKTTMFNLITGFIRPNKGKIVYDGKDITGLRPYEIAELGIGRTFQLNPLFPDFTVLENVMASFHLRPKSSVLDTFFNTARYRNNEKYILEKSLETLNLLGISHIKDKLAKNLPHGYQKMLGIARALAVNPRLLLLDEPISGMNPDEIDFTLSAVKNLKEQGITIILIEHNMRIMDLCDRVIVIDFGQKIAEGSPEEVGNNREVVQAYFGGEHVT